MTYIENRKHTFAIADLGQFDLDEDRSITPSIKMALRVEGIEADVDGEEVEKILIEKFALTEHATHIGHLPCVPTTDVLIEAAIDPKRIPHAGDAAGVPATDVLVIGGLLKGVVHFCDAAGVPITKILLKR